MFLIIGTPLTVCVYAHVFARLALEARVCQPGAR